MSDKKNDHVPTAAELSQRLDRVVAQQEKTAAQSNRTEAQVAETAATVKEMTKQTNEQINKLAKQIGGVDRIFGEMAEYVSYTNLSRLLAEQASIKIERVGKRFKAEYAGHNYEFDLVALGTGVVVVIEVKTTLRSESIDDFAAMMPDFTAIFPEYEGRDVYGGFAYMKAHDGAEDRAHKHGLLTIRAIGGSTSQLVGFDQAKLRNFRNVVA